MDVTEILNQNQAKIGQIAKKYKIKLVYLYGSHARGQQTPMSDIDLAVLFEDDLADEKYLDNKLNFGGEIEKAFNLRDVDVRALNNYSPRFRFTVYQEGKLIYTKDEDTRIDFQLKAFHDYQDIKHIYEISDYYLFQRLKSRQY